MAAEFLILRRRRAVGRGVRRADSDVRRAISVGFCISCSAHDDRKTSEPPRMRPRAAAPQARQDGAARSTISIIAKERLIHVYSM